MRSKSFPNIGLLILASAVVLGAIEPAEKRPAVIQYQKEIAPVIAEAMTSFPAAKQRYREGLPKGSELHVSVRLLDVFERVVFVQMSVTKIDAKKGEVTGRILNEIPKATLYPAAYKFDTVEGRVLSGSPETKRHAQGDTITIPEVMIVDWRIVRSDGTSEGGVLAHFLAGKGPDADPTKLLEDEEAVAKEELLASPELAQAIEKSFLQFFDDPELKFENVRDGELVIRVWPALAGRFRNVPVADLTKKLTARVDALKPTLRFEVSQSGVNSIPMLIISEYIVMKRREFVFSMRVFLHLRYASASTLDKAVWGGINTRPIKLKATVK